MAPINQDKEKLACGATTAQPKGITSILLDTALLSMLYIGDCHSKKVEFEEELDVTITFDSEPGVEVEAKAVGRPSPTPMSMAKQVLGGDVLLLWQTGNLSDH